MLVIFFLKKLHIVVITRLTFFDINNEDKDVVLILKRVNRIMVSK